MMAKAMHAHSLLQRSTRGHGSEEHLEGRLCALSFSTLQTFGNGSVYISRRSSVSMLLLSCVPGGGVKSFQAGVAIIEVDTG